MSEAVFYAYAYTELTGFRTYAVKLEAAYFFEAMDEFILPYKAVRMAADPDRALFAFLQTTYEERPIWPVGIAMGLSVILSRTCALGKAEKGAGRAGKAVMGKLPTGNSSHRGQGYPSPSSVEGRKNHCFLITSPSPSLKLLRP